MWQLVIVATFANTLGGITAYWLGRLGDYGKIERYVGVSEDKAKIFKDRVRPMGTWVAFFAFVPFIGDVLVVALGLVNAPALPSIVLMGFGKLMRYIVVANFHEDVERITRSIFDFLT